jgi:hypothetical protein
MDEDMVPLIPTHAVITAFYAILAILVHPSANRGSNTKKPIGKRNPAPEMLFTGTWYHHISTTK